MGEATKKQFNNNDFTIKFANEEEYDITQYDPRTRCKAVKDVKGQRDFTKNKTTSTSSTTESASSPTFNGTGMSHNLSEEQVKRLVVGCIQENGNTQQAIQAEASLMCNLAESSRGNKWNHNVYQYVLYGKWFGGATVRKINGSGWSKITTEQYNWGKEIFNDGKRTVPNYIDEHDMFPGDIAWVKYNGPGDSKTYGNLSRSSLISGKSILHNIYGSTYTFWMFFRPDNKGDPYGSTYYPSRF